MTSGLEGRIAGVIGPCSAGRCRRPAVRHLELVTAEGQLSGIVCERCARATLSALFLIDLIA